MDLCATYSLCNIYGRAGLLGHRIYACIIPLSTARLLPKVIVPVSTHELYAIFFPRSLIILTIIRFINMFNPINVKGVSNCSILH